MEMRRESAVKSESSVTQTSFDRLNMTKSQADRNTVGNAIEFERAKEKGGKNHETNVSDEALQA